MILKKLLTNLIGLKQEDDLEAEFQELQNYQSLR